MKTLLRFLALILIASTCHAQALRLMVVSNAAAFHGKFSGELGEELVISVYIENVGKESMTVVTSPKRTLNIDSLKAIYWYDLEGVGGRIVVPDPYALRPLLLKPGTLAKIDELRLPVSSLKKTLGQEHATMEVSYQIDESLAPWLHVWTGELKESVVLK